MNKTTNNNTHPLFAFDDSIIMQSTNDISENKVIDMDLTDILSPTMTTQNNIVCGGLPVERTKEMDDLNDNDVGLRLNETMTHDLQSIENKSIILISNTIITNNNCNHPHNSNSPPNNNTNNNTNNTNNSDEPCMIDDEPQHSSDNKLNESTCSDDSNHSGESYLSYALEYNYSADDTNHYTRTGESIDLDDPLCHRRKLKCEQLLQCVLKNRVVLVRSPPCSGKSSMARLLEVYAKERANIDVSIVNYLELEEEEDDKLADVNGFVKKATGHSFGTHYQHHKLKRRQSLGLPTTLPKPLLLIFDETQLLYPLTSQHYFWKKIKCLLQDPASSSLSIVLFAAYGGNGPERKIDEATSINTPIRIEHTFGVEFLNLNRLEYDEMIQMELNYLEKHPSAGFPLAHSTREMLWNASGGHVEIVRSFLAQMRRFRSNMSRIADNQRERYMNGYLMSSEFITYLTQTNQRMFASGDFDDVHKSILNRIITSDNDEEAFVNPDEFTTRSINQLVYMGFITQTPQGAYRFPSPITQIVVMNGLYHGIPGEEPTSLPKFVTQCLSYFYPTMLAKSLSKGANDRLFEKQFQNEFYRCARSVLGNYALCCPEVGPVFGTRGYIDFFVSKYQWGIEILRNGSKLKEHTDRFAPKGRYGKLPMNKWLILDFYTPGVTPKYVPNKDSNIWTIQFRSEYSQMYIMRPGQQEADMIPLTDSSFSLRSLHFIPSTSSYSSPPSSSKLTTKRKSPEASTFIASSLQESPDSCVSSSSAVSSSSSRHVKRFRRHRSRDHSATTRRSPRGRSPDYHYSSQRSPRGRSPDYHYSSHNSSSSKRSDIKPHHSSRQRAPRGRSPDYHHSSQRSPRHYSSHRSPRGRSPDYYYSSHNSSSSKRSDIKPHHSSRQRSPRGRYPDYYYSSHNSSSSKRCDIKPHHSSRQRSPRRHY